MTLRLFSQGQPRTPEELRLELRNAALLSDPGPFRTQESFLLKSLGSEAPKMFWPRITPEPNKYHVELLVPRKVQLFPQSPGPGPPRTPNKFYFELRDVAKPPLDATCGGQAAHVYFYELECL